MEPSPALNTDELMHLALYATDHDAPDKAILHLKKLLDIQPDNGKAHYLLGALHAEIGLYDQAIGEMTHSLELEPDLATARFQLGLLHLTAGGIEAADEVWQGLDELGDDNPLFRFKTGMLHLVKDEFAQCVDALRAGIELNTLNEKLNNDMRRVLADAERALADTRDTQSGREANGSDGKSETNGTNNLGQRMLLSIYEKQNTDEL